MKNVIFLAVIAVSLSGCATKTEMERIKECEDKGISRDICYQEERSDRRAEKFHQDIMFDKQNAQVIKDMGIKGLGLPK